MIKFPLAHIVKIDIHGNRLYLFYICCHNIGIPDRSEFDFIKCRIMCNNFYCGNSGICLNIDFADFRSIVALIVASREFNMMYSVCKHSIGY